MTAEQLNIIITAQTADFKEKISEVNQSLRETIALSQKAAAAAASVGGDIDAEADGESNDPVRAAFAEYAGAAEARTPELPAVRKAALDTGAARITDFETFVTSADVIELNKEQTLIGAVRQSAGDRYTQGAQETPVEIHTTVELDGDRVGEAVAAYNARRSRITDGFSG